MNEIEDSDTVELSYIDENDIKYINNTHIYIGDRIQNTPNLAAMFDGISLAVGKIGKISARIKAGKGTYKDYYTLRRLIGRIINEIQKLKEELDNEIHRQIMDQDVK
jgi:hypothetical protein